MKKELDRFGVSSAGCVEKNDFAAMLKDVWVKREQHFAEKKLKEEVRCRPSSRFARIIPQASVCTEERNIRQQRMHAYASFRASPSTLSVFFLCVC